MFSSYAARYVFSANSQPIKNGLIRVDSEGMIISVKETDSLMEGQSLSFFEGILIPGIFPNEFYDLPMKSCSIAVLQHNYLIAVNKLLKEYYLVKDSLSFIQWVSLHTISMAERVGNSDRFGTFEPGKRPGILYICHFNYEEMNITEQSYFRVIHFPDFMHKV